jgi:CubicO group peptidase (beta-lactamase class C family)
MEYSMRFLVLSVFAAAALAVGVACAPAQTPDAETGSTTRMPGTETDSATAELGAELRRYLDTTEPLGFSGAFLVARGRDVILHEGYGLADRENRTPYAAGTVFDIGSITKQFTAAGILKLEEEGRLRVSDPISRFFTGVPGDKQAITIHHLLTHSAGLIGDFGNDYEVMPRDSLVGLALASPLQSVPGTLYAYSNAGYSLLGAIIEIASGTEYERYLHERLFVPAGMRQTGYTLADWTDAGLAVGYRGASRWGTPLDQLWAEDGPWWNLRANGGMLSTLGDLFSWHLALKEDAVLSAESKAKLFAPHVPTNAEGSRHYGYGWTVSRTARDTRLVAHNGGNPYFFADFNRFVDEDVVILMASNEPDMREKVFPVRRRVIDMVFDALPPSPSSSYRDSPAGAREIRGTPKLAARAP